MSKQNSYYGSFFWLAAISFVVPVFVALYAFDAVRPTSKPASNPDASGVDQNLLDYLLRSYVQNGLVDYDGLARDYLFKTYINQLAGAQPEKLETEDERLALFCNAYNALVINGVIVHKIHKNEKNVLSYTPPAASQKIDLLTSEIKKEKQTSTPREKAIAQWTAELKKLRRDFGFFSLKEHIFAGETISLDYLEHDVIRPKFQEPRVHVALVCAAKSCPAIRAEAYVGSRVREQLEDQSKAFANNLTYVRYDSASESLKLSPILNWYGDDWSSQGGYLNWLKQRVESPELGSQVAAAESGELAVEFNAYDWTLNSQDTGSSSAGGDAHFGSGTVPNE